MNSIELSAEAARVCACVRAPSIFARLSLIAEPSRLSWRVCVLADSSNCMGSQMTGLEMP